MSLSWCQKVSPTQGVDKEQREGVCDTVDRGKERIDERKIVSKTHGHNTLATLVVAAGTAMTAAPVAAGTMAMATAPTAACAAQRLQQGTSSREGGARSLHGPYYHILFCSLL